MSELVLPGPPQRDPAWLVDNPPASKQFHAPRRGNPLGIGLHTTESMPDVIGPDDGAERVARFIENRPDAGSYNRLVDSDSILPLIPDSWEAFGARSLRAYGYPYRVNPYTLHVSFATRADDWPNLPPDRRERFGLHAAIVCAEWVIEYGIPIRRATMPEIAEGIRTGRPFGIFAHADADPRRRRDPGLTDHEFSLFLVTVEEVVDIITGGSDMSRRIVIRAPKADLGPPHPSAVYEAEMGHPLVAVGAPDHFIPPDSVVSAIGEDDAYGWVTLADRVSGARHGSYHLSNVGR